MKVKNVIDTLNNIDDVRQVLISADKEEGTHVPYDIVETILILLHDYEADILSMDVIRT